MLMRKGKKWALSCVAISAVVLTGMSATTVNADETDSATATTQSTGNQTDQNQTSGNNVQAAKGAVTQSTVQDTTNTADSTNATQTASAQSSATAQAPVATQSSTSGVATQVANNNDEVPSGGKVSDDFSNENKNQLGYASNFHIFANEATLNAHTNGNLAVGTLNGNVNFGTNIHKGYLDKDISYVQNHNKIANSSFVEGNDDRVNKVVFGEQNNISFVSQKPIIYVDGTKIDHLTKDEVFQDKNGEKYIDFNEYFGKLENKSNSIANMDPVITIDNSNFSDFNQRVINLEEYQPNEKNQIVINLDPDVLKMSTPLTIFGLSDKKDSGTSVIINVDTQGADPYVIDSQIKLIYSDKTTNHTERPNQETDYFDDNHLLWNFYDSTASDKLYDGQIDVEKPFQGSVLAPKATVNVDQNLDGNIVADKVIVNAETHRWDLQDDNVEETEFEKPVVIPGEVDFMPEPGDGGNTGSNIDEPDEEEEEDIIDPDTGELKPENPDENNNEDNGGGTTDPENPDENNNEDNDGNEDGDDNDGDNSTDPKDPDENNNEDEDDTTDTDDNGGSTVTPDTDKEEEEDSDSEEATTDEDGNQNLINGDSESSQAENNAEEGLLPSTSGNKGESETPTTGTSDEAGTLPQTGEASSIFATIAGVFLIIFGFLLKTTKTKKN